MSIDFKKVVAVAVAVCAPLMLNAELKHMSKTALPQGMKNIPKIKVICPKGWKLTYNIANTPDKWGDNSPVITCKPIKPVMECPEHTYFYVKGNENIDGYSNGEIGCHTPVR